MGWKNGAWRTFLEGWQWGQGSFHKVLDPLVPGPQHFWGHGQMREIILADAENDQLPPSNHPLPPFYDPCNLLPEIPPGDIEVIPLSDRFFGIYDMSPTQMNELFNGTKRSTGTWLIPDLAIMASRNAVLVGSQGSYPKFMPNGGWNLNDFLSVTDGMLGPVYSTLLTHTGTGAFFGYSMIDDFSSPRRWPPNGVPLNELIAAVAYLHSNYPGIRIGIRGRATQFSAVGNPGFDFFSCQFVEWRNIPAFNFGAIEYGLCKSWGAFCMLDVNLLHGGSGESGMRYAQGSGVGASDHNFICSANEIANYFSDMYDGALSVDGTCDKLAGSLGWRMDPILFTVPNFLNGCSVAHNALAALPPL
jgi:hypothetical protein